MSKKTDSTLLIPGPDGWELWQGTRELGLNRILDDGPSLASEIEKVPSGPLLMGFPVREALAIPFKAQTSDESMFEDLADMQLEKIGVRPEEGAGQLTDVFSAGQSNEDSILLSVVLAPPEEGTMPLRSPGDFDISARFFQMEDNAVTLWCELGRWVFAVKSNGHLLYFQSLPGTGVTTDAVRDVKLALNQLRLQGMNVQVTKAVVWVSGRDADPSDEQIREFATSLGYQMVFAEKPRPVFPETMSKLLPADVKAEQRMRQERMKRNIGIAAILVIYLALVGYLAFDYITLSRQVAQQDAELENIRLEHGDMWTFNDEWDELYPVVESRHWPLTILKSTASLISPKQDLRYTVFDAHIGKVTIRGEAADINMTSSYSGKLRRSISDYKWSLPPATHDAKTKRRKFTYVGVLEGSETEL